MTGAADYELSWPRALFVDEATAILEQFIGPQVIDACTVLLQEAFCGRGPVLDFNAAARGTFVSADSQRAFVQSLIDQAEKIPTQENRPIWPGRHHVAGPAELLDRQRQLPRAFTDLVTDFHDHGYFARSFGDSVDNLNPDLVLAERFGSPGLWPLRPDRWNEDTFYGLIEVLHDLVARPRMSVRPPDGWQAPFYVVETGRRLYRWRVNRLLDTAELGLRLADTGEDAGRLVATVDPARAELLDRALLTPNAIAAGRYGTRSHCSAAAVPTRTPSAPRSSPSRAYSRVAASSSRPSCFARTRGPCSKSPMSSTSATTGRTRREISTRRSSTGCSGGTWPLSN